MRPGLIYGKLQYCKMEKNFSPSISASIFQPSDRMSDSAHDIVITHAESTVLLVKTLLWPEVELWDWSVSVLTFCMGCASEPVCTLLLWSDVVAPWGCFMIGVDVVVIFIFWVLLCGSVRFSGSLLTVTSHYKQTWGLLKFNFSHHLQCQCNLW